MKGEPYCVKCGGDLASHGTGLDFGTNGFLLVSCPDPETVKLQWQARRQRESASSR